MPVNTAARAHAHDETAGGDGIATGTSVDQRDAAPPRYIGVTQRVIIDKATGGNFTLTTGGHTTANIAHNATPAAVAAALNALPSVGAAAVNEVQTLTVDASSGTYTLTYAGETTDPIAENAANTDVQNALLALDVFTVNNCPVVTGSAGGPYTITFSEGDLAGTNLPLIVGASVDLGGTGAHTADVTQATAGHPLVAGVAVTGEAGDYVIEFVGAPDPRITAADTLTGTGHTIDVVTL